MGAGQIEFGEGVVENAGVNRCYMATVLEGGVERVLRMELSQGLQL